jgi:hypothetical protein
MSRDRIDALADELFAAAREERPESTLVGRVERATEMDEAGRLGVAPPPARPLLPPAERTRRGARRPPYGRVLLAALVVGALATPLLLTRARDGVVISAEHPPSRSTSGAAEPTRGAAGVSPGEGANADAMPRAEAAPTALRDVQRPSAATPDERTRSAEPPPRVRAESRRVPERAPASESVTPPAAGGSDALAGEKATTSAEPPPATSTLAHELGALKQIRQALRNQDGSAALALLDRYDRGDYGTRLALEAQVLRVEALDASGRGAEAEALARRFVRENPDSPLAERAQRYIDGTGSAQSGGAARQP